MDFRWEVESAPERVLADLRNRIVASSSDEPYLAYFDMPELYAGESLVSG